MSQTAQPVNGQSSTQPGQQPGQTTLWSMLTVMSAEPAVPTRPAEPVTGPDAGPPLGPDPVPERRDAGDEIVRHIAIPLSAQARSWGGYRFGFTRSLDPERPAVQLHLRATEDVVKRVWKFAHALAAGQAATLGPVEFSPSTDMVYPPRPGEPVAELMESTCARFGGVQGLKLVGDVSELSADLAMWAVNRFPRSSTRATLGALLLFDTAHAMMRGPRSAVWPDRRTTSWDYYWNTHLRICTSSFGSQAEHARKAMMARMAPRIMPAHRVMGALAAEPSVDLWRKRWVQATDLYLYRADKQRISRSAQQLALASSGVLLNRLGIPLREEAALGLAARAWSKEKEAQLRGEG